MKTGRIKKFFDDRGYGFIKPDLGGLDIFFHMFDGRQVEDNGTDAPRVMSDVGPRACKPDDESDHGAPVMYEETPGRNGRPKACPWVWTKDYERVLDRIAERKAEVARQTEERLRCNPLFRAWEERVCRDGQREGRRAIFIGTKRDFICNYPLNRKYDPLASTQFNGVDMRYERWFERKTADGWVACGDPRTIKLQLTFEQARVLLSGADFDCLKDRAFGDEEFGWHKDGQQIAYGVYSQGEYSLSIKETSIYAQTSFGGKVAQQLYDAGGKTRHVEYNDAGDPRATDDVLDLSEVEGFCAED